jgi:predicted regulator of Ras-like GTPase activity (Roadblock/LC7/MglB family)
MQTKDFATQHTLTFLSNKSNFSKQPLFLLTNNMGLTGDDFIALYRITRGQALSGTFRESAAISDTGATNAVSGDGIIGITIGSSDGLTSASGSNRINANSITAAAGVTGAWASAANAATSSLLSITSPGTQYIVTMTMKGTDRIDVIVNNGEENAGDITLTGLPELSTMNIIGNGIRPKGKQLSTYVVDAATDMNGNAGSADITTYLYNNQDQQQVWTSSGLTGVFDLSFNGLSAAVKGKAAGHGAMQTAGVQGAGSGTVTGWTAGPMEGGFRLDNSSYLEGVTSSLFNTRYHTTTGMTLMTYVRFHATGSNQAFMDICGAEDGFKLSMSGGTLCFDNTRSSITAGALTTAAGTVGTSTNNQAGAHNVLLNKWYHVAGVVTATGSNSGMRIYVDGKRMILARTRSTGGTINESDFPLSGTVSGSQDQDTAASADVIAMPTLTSPRLLMGSDRTLAGANVPFDVSLTRVFNRPLSDSEVFQNFIGTIPSNATISNFKIG